MTDKDGLLWPKSSGPASIAYNVDIRHSLLENTAKTFIDKGIAAVDVAFVDNEGNFIIEFLQDEKEIDQCASSGLNPFRAQTDAANSNEGKSVN